MEDYEKIKSQPLLKESDIDSVMIEINQIITEIVKSEIIKESKLQELKE